MSVQQLALPAAVAVAIVVLIMLWRARRRGRTDRPGEGQMLALMQAERDVLRANHAVEIAALEGRLAKALAQAAGARLGSGEDTARRELEGRVAALATEREELKQRAREMPQLVAERDHARAEALRYAQEASRLAEATQAAGGDALGTDEAVQAARAEADRQAEVAAELRREVEALRGRAEDDGDAARLAGELAAAREALEAARRAVDERDGAIAELRAAGSDDEAAGLRTTLVAAETRERAANESLSRLAYERENLKSRVATLERSQSEAKAETERHAAQLELRLTKVYDLEARLREANEARAAAERALAERPDDADRLQSKLDDVHGENRGLLEELEAMRRDVVEAGDDAATPTDGGALAAAQAALARGPRPNGCAARPARCRAASERGRASGAAQRAAHAGRALRRRDRSDRPAGAGRTVARRPHPRLQGQARRPACRRLNRGLTPRGVCRSGTVLASSPAVRAQRHSTHLDDPSRSECVRSTSALRRPGLVWSATWPSRRRTTPHGVGCTSSSRSCSSPTSASRSPCRWCRCSSPARSGSATSTPAPRRPASSSSRRSSPAPPRAASSTRAARSPPCCAASPSTSPARWSRSPQALPLPRDQPPVRHRLRPHLWFRRRDLVEACGVRVGGEIAIGLPCDLPRCLGVCRRDVPQQLSPATPVHDQSSARQHLVHHRPEPPRHGRCHVRRGSTQPGFAGAEMLFRADVYVPLGAFPLFGAFPGKMESGYSTWLSLVGRLRDGATASEAAAQLAVVSRRLAAAKVVDPTFRSVVQPFDGGEEGSALPAAFTVLFGAAAVVLLVVCANVAALLLVRGMERVHDAGVRAAIGAGRVRLAREALAESLVLAAVGCVLGVGVAAWGVRALLGLIPTVGTPVALHAPLDGRVLAVALGALAAVVAGLAPALRAMRVDPAVLLRAGGRGAAGRRPRLVGALVAAQVAFAVVALVTAGLFARTYAELRRVDTGLRAPDHVLVTWTDFGYLGRRDAAEQRAGVVRALDRVRALPGVRAAAAADFVPLGNRGHDAWTTQVIGYTPRPDESMDVATNRVTPAYFVAVGTPVVRGRGFTEADAPGAPRVVVVSEAFARRYFAGGDALGGTVVLGGDTATIVGVARDARYKDQDLTLPPRPFLYEAYAQRPIATIAFLVRTGGDPTAVTPALRRAVAAVDPALPLTAPMTLAEWSANATLLQQIMAEVLGGLGACALALAGVGVFGVIAYAAARRRREVGVRAALGATTRDIVRLFVGAGVRLAAVGLACGALLAVGAAQVVRSQLYGVSPVDPVAFGGAALVLAAVAVAASWLPARRAARVDPVEVLRAE